MVHYTPTRFIYFFGARVERDSETCCYQFLAILHHCLSPSTLKSPVQGCDLGSLSGVWPQGPAES